MVPLAALLAWLGCACGAGSGGSHDHVGDAGSLDGGIVGAADVILLVSGANLVMPYGATEKVQVLLLRGGETPIAGALVQFTMHGRANDSSLSHISFVTDASGMALVDIQSGYVESTFSVRVAAEGFEPIYVSVTVSSGDLATLSVKPTSSLEPARHRIQLYGGATCDSPRVEARDFDRTTILWQGSAQADLPYLPVADDYVVTVEALDDAGDVVALRCVDAVALDQDGALVVVDLDAHVVDPDGDYDAELRLDLGEEPGVWAASMRDALAEIEADDLPEADHLISALEARLVQLGDTDGLAALSMVRESTVEALDAWLAGRGPVAAVHALTAELASLSVLESRGVLSVARPDTLGYLESARTFEDAGGGRVDAPTGSWTASGAFVSPVQSTATLATAALPSLVATHYFAAIATDGDAQAWLEELAGCDALATFTPVVSLGTSCDEACLNEVCGALVAQTYESALAKLDEGLAPEASLVVDGTLVFVEPAFASQLASRFEGTGLTVSFPGQDADIGASFAGARLP